MNNEEFRRLRICLRRLGEWERARQEGEDYQDECGRRWQD